MHYPALLARPFMLIDSLVFEDEEADKVGTPADGVCVWRELPQSFVDR